MSPIMNFFGICLIFLSTIIKGQLSSLQEVLAKAELEIYIEDKKMEINTRYKLLYHITPPCGWMNGPNGFSVFKGEFHLFYQFYPYDTQWGPMHWGHMASSNLVDWKQLPTALIPGNEQCFSGSAIDNDGILAIIYTGHEPSDEPPFYNETQYLAYSVDGIIFQKYRGNPVLMEAPYGAQDFRDPKVWKHGHYWYVIIGIKTEDQKGAVVLYRSMNMVNWEYLNVMAESNGELGFMWECPDFFEINGKFILLISPQGMIAKGDRYKNTYQTGYIVGSFNYETLEFVPEVSFQELDFGHDFYATQTTEKDGKRYIVGWFGMWESEHPEAVDGWVGAMTLIRELDLVGSRLLMKPVDAISNLRIDTVIEGELKPNSSIEFGKTGEIIVNLDLSEIIELEIRGVEDSLKTLVIWKVDEGKVMVDRAGEVRQALWEPLDTVTWRIFLDASSMELFCGEGELVFSSRIYPVGNWKVTNLSPQSLHVVGYRLRKSMPL